MQQFSEFISSVGFPIAAYCALAFLLWKMWLHIKETCDILTKTNKDLVKANSNLVSSINIKLDKLIEKIK